jgi:hypothetical protein
MTKEYYCAVENPLTIGGSMCLNPDHEHNTLTLDQRNNANLTKGGQSRTAVGATEAEIDRRMALIDEEREVATMNDAGKTTLITERGEVAYHTAIGLGYLQSDARVYAAFAEIAARHGLETNRTAGRVTIGHNDLLTEKHPRRFVLSIIGPTGALFDPMQPSSPDNSLGGSD